VKRPESMGSFLKVSRRISGPARNPARAGSGTAPLHPSTECRIHLINANASMIPRQSRTPPPAPLPAAWENPMTRWHSASSRILTLAVHQINVRVRAIVKRSSKCRMSSRSCTTARCFLHTWSEAPPTAAPNQK